MRIKLLLPLLLLPLPALAQDQSVEEKLRQLLQQTTEQLRAAQDNAATLQTQLDTMTKQRDDAQAQLTAAQAKANATNPKQEAELQKAQADAQAARAEVSSNQAALDKWQKAYQDAAGLARDKDASDRRNAAALKAASAQLAIAKDENAKLIAVAEDILHLYQTPQFNRLLIANHDRVIGLARVKLENTVQDYEDKLDAQSYVEPVTR